MEKNQNARTENLMGMVLTSVLVCWNRVDLNSIKPSILVKFWSRLFSTLSAENQEPSTL